MSNPIRYFAWFEYRGRDKIYMPGPYFDQHVKEIGSKSSVHSLEEVLRISFSDSIKKRIAGARPNTEIKIHHTSSNSALWIKRLTDEQVAKYEEWKKNKEKLSSLCEQINALIPSTMKNEKKELERQIKKAVEKGIFI